MPRPILHTTAFALALFFLNPIQLHAATAIGNGKRFICEGKTILSVRTGAETPASKALRIFRRIIRKQKQRIAAAPRGSKKRKRAITAKKNARLGLGGVKLCRDQDSPGTTLYDGLWNLTLENGMTAAENGFTSLTIQFSVDSFVSEFDGSLFDCHWEGAYTSSDGPSMVTLNTTVGTGGTTCEQAIGQSKTAAASFTDNGDTLTLDYRPEGALQVFARVG